MQTSTSPLRCQNTSLPDLSEVLILAATDRCIYACSTCHILTRWGLLAEAEISERWGLLPSPWRYNWTVSAFFYLSVLPGDTDKLVCPCDLFPIRACSDNMDKQVCPCHPVCNRRFNLIGIQFKEWIECLATGIEYADIYFTPSTPEYIFSWSAG